MSRVYFAQSQMSELLPKLVGKIKHFNDHCERNGMRSRWETGHKLYYGEHLGESGGRSTSVQYGGDAGELTAFGVNHYRNLIKLTQSVATGQKPSYDPRAKNTDLQSIQQTRLANNILDAYVTEKRMGRHLMATSERSLVYSIGFSYMTWEPQLGRPYTTKQETDENGNVVEKVIYEGDVSIRSKSPFDVMYDTNLTEWSQNRWVIVRELENRWDLIARYPEMSEQIKAFEADDSLDMRSRASKWVNQNIDAGEENDLVPVYHFYHLRTESMPNGRYVKFLGDNLGLYDGPIPYRKRLPIFRMTPGERFDTADGYSDALDIMVLQQVVNVLYSTAFTNQQAFGTQAIWMPDGCEISATQLGKGLAVLKGGPPGSQPIPLQLTATPREIFENITLIENSMQKLMGMNSAMRGDPDHNLKSGVALARLQAMAIQYSSSLQKAWAELLEDTGSFLLELLQDFANTERMVALAGKHNKGAMQSFTGQDLNQIERVAVDLGNPIQNTTSGRIEMAESLLSQGAITAKQYIQVAISGNLDTATEASQSQEELIRKENESLMSGEPVRAVVGDAHIMHSQEHMTVINDPMLRTLAAQGDQQAIAIVMAVTEHINEHKMLHAQQEPFWTMLTGEPPPPPPMPGPMGPPPMPGDDPMMAPMPPPPGIEASATPPPPAPMPGPLPGDPQV